MRHAASARQPAPARSGLAKLVIGTSVVVAVATSAPPVWDAEEVWSQRVFLNDRPARAFRLTVELDGELYADAFVQNSNAVAIADRAASDMTLALRRLTPPVQPEAPDAGAPSGPSGTPDAGARSGTTDTVLGYPSPNAANQAEVRFDIECADNDSDHVVRPERCVEQFELRLARSSERPLSAELRISVYAVGGRRERRPPGTFELRVEELSP